MADARFEDGVENPLRLRAEGAEDLSIVSTLIQDAVSPVSEIAWQPRARRFALLINRFRWEDRIAAERARRDFERVQTLLIFEDVMAVRANGVDPADKDLVIAILGLVFEPGEDGQGRITIALSGEGEIALDVECINIMLRDVTRPHKALSKLVPNHPLEG